MVVAAGARRVGGEAGEDQLSTRSGRQRLGDREQVVEAALVSGEHEHRAQAPAHGLLGRELGVLAQDRALELTQDRRRLDPELVDERLPRRPVDVERFRLPTGAVERPHQRADETLVQRMRAHERLELGHELGVAAEREVGLDAQLERGEAHLLEALRISGCASSSSARSGEGFAAPEADRLAEQARSRPRLGAFRLADESLEAEQVELVGVDADQVARDPA